MENSCKVGLWFHCEIVSWWWVWFIEVFMKYDIKFSYVLNWNPPPPHTHTYMLRTRILTKVWSVDYIVLVCWIKTDIAIFINHVIILCSWQSQYCLNLCFLMLLVYCTDYSLTRVDFITSVLTVILSSMWELKTYNQFSHHHARLLGLQKRRKNKNNKFSEMHTYIKWL